MSPRRLVLVLCALLALTSAAPAAAQTTGPLTGLEERLAAAPGGAAVDWTSLEEETGYLAALDAVSDRMAVDVIGSSSLGRPMRLVRLGAPAPRTLAESSEGRVVLFTCSQHGDEPAGREGCLRQIRTLALSNDQAILDHLATTSVLFVPTANPDGRAANTRENAQAIDINRDHLDPLSPEARAIDTVIRDARPDVVADMHEYRSRALYDTELLYLWPRNRNVDPSVHRLSRQLSRRYIRAGAEGAGFSADVYGITMLDGQAVGQDAGDEDERILRNVVGLRHSIGLLVETDVRANRRNSEEAGSEAAVQARRVASHVQAIADVLRFQRQNADEVEAATEGAAARAAAEGARRDLPFYLGGADNRLPPSTEVLYPPPCAYDITAEQASRLAGTFAVHGIQTVVRGGDVRVPLSQAAQPLIPLLLDAAARFSPVDGRRVTTCEPGV